MNMASDLLRYLRAIAFVLKLASRLHAFYLNVELSATFAKTNLASFSRDRISLFGTQIASFALVFVPDGDRSKISNRDLDAARHYWCSGTCTVSFEPREALPIDFRIL